MTRQCRAGRHISVESYIEEFHYFVYLLQLCSPDISATPAVRMQLDAYTLQKECAFSAHTSSRACFQYDKK
jgi:hypothetical protein